MSTFIAAKPFVKWAGGKRSILSELLLKIPDHINDYYEPFVGGGSLFFKIHKLANACYLSDLNSDLMDCYAVIREYPELLIKQLKLHQRRHCKEYYYQMRNDVEATGYVPRAARFIYLMQTCYNGVYRVNRRDQFNTALGAHKKPVICNEDNLRAVSQVLQGIDLKKQDFIVIDPKPGDFVYFDPPYYGCFSQYTNYGFSAKDHIRLRDFVLELTDLGVNVMISNTWNDFIVGLFQSKCFRLTKIMASRRVSCKGNGRGDVAELLITNY